MYNVHFTAYIRQLLPPPIRKEPLISVCEVLFRPAKTLFSKFRDYRRSALLEITATGQVAVMEHNLARLVGVPVNYIYISGGAATDFAVLVPDFLTDTQMEIVRQHVSAHKLSGKSFEIIINN